MLTVQGLVCGTPEYMSPEQARGEPLDGRADLYSAAVILYHMVTGDIPFRASTPIGIVSRHLSDAPVAPSARCPEPVIPADLDQLILRGLAKNRESRPATALVFQQELEDVGSGRPDRQTRAGNATLPATEATSGLALAAQGHRLAATRSPRRGVPRMLAIVGAGVAVVAFAAAGVAIAGRVFAARCRHRQTRRRWRRGPTPTGAGPIAAAPPLPENPAIRGHGPRRSRWSLWNRWNLRLFGRNGVLAGKGIFRLVRRGTLAAAGQKPARGRGGRRRGNTGAGCRTDDASY